MSVLSTSSKLAAVSSTIPVKEVESLQKQIRELQDANQQLQEALHAVQTGGVAMRGYLNRFRSPAMGVMGLFAQEWELRYYILTGSLLRAYKSERDSAFNPRGTHDLQGCCVDLEGDSTAQLFRFRICRQHGGPALLRLSTDNRQAAEQWVAALQGAGLQVHRRSETPGARQSSEGGGMLLSDTMPAGAAGRAAVVAAAAQQERWEASSTDSELPEQPRQRRKPREPAVSTAHTSSTHGSGVDSATAGAAFGRASVTASSISDGSSARDAACRAVRAADVAVAAASRPPMVGSTPVHTVTRYSYLSSDGIWAAKHDGLLNLGMVILVATNFRLILENLLKYGIRVHLLRYVRASFSGGGGNLPLVLSFPALLAFAAIALATERLALLLLRGEEAARDALAKRDAPPAAAAALEARVRRHEAFILALNVVNTSAALVLPCVVVLRTAADPGPGFVLTLCTICVWMKLVSYAHCNADLRAAHRANSLRPGERGAPEAEASWAVLRFPDNLTPGNLVWFLAAPTLTYQVNFPRSARIRKRWLMRRCAELAVWLGLLLFMVDQYVSPTVANSMQPLREMDFLRIAERILKLSLPHLYCWLAMFYCLFHLWLNILGELTRFGDREFYKDWWNAATVGDYWKLWNMPVHKWLLRTVYFPAMRAGIPRYWSLVLVFFVSAVFHELAVGVPLGNLNAWAFSGIMLQVPLISITDKLQRRLKSDTWGNLIFWVTFCFLGQPVSLLMYYHDYVVEHRAQYLGHAATGQHTGSVAGASSGLLAATNMTMLPAL